MNYSIILLLFIFNHFSLYSTHNTDKEILAFSVETFLNCPWATQYLHNEKECANCKNAQKNMITENYTHSNKKLMITRKSNLEITGFITNILKATIQEGLVRCKTHEKKQELITNIADWFKSNKSDWYSVYKNLLSENNSEIPLIECAYKQNCSMYLYTMEKTVTKELRTFNLNLPITSFTHPHSDENIITAPHGKALFYSFYSTARISNLLNIFALTTIPSNNSKSYFNANLKYHFWNHIIDYLNQKLETLDK